MKHLGFAIGIILFAYYLEYNNELTALSIVGFTIGYTVAELIFNFLKKKNDNNLVDK